MAECDSAAKAANKLGAFMPVLQHGSG
jgi:hypothetical protein